MEDLSLHILDIVQNSIKAEAELIIINITVDKKADKLTISVVDDGFGMDEDMIKRVTDPFFTTRTTRSVGLGIPLLKAAAQSTGGDLIIKSKPGDGTELTVWLGISNIDRPPTGSMEDTMVTLVICNPDIDFVFTYNNEDGNFKFDTREIRQMLDGVPLDNPSVIDWIKGYISEGIAKIGIVD